jgi:hypothetical protein
VVTGASTREERERSGAVWRQHPRLTLEAGQAAESADVGSGAQSAAAAMGDAPSESVAYAGAREQLAADMCSQRGPTGSGCNRSPGRRRSSPQQRGQ